MLTTLKQMDKKSLLMAAAMAAAATAVIAPDLVQAGTGGTEFAGVWTTLTDWVQGTLGRIAAGAFVLVGIIAGVARQSLMAFAVGIGGGVGLYNTPSILDNVLSATLEHVPAAAQAAVTLSNGLNL